MIGSDEGDRERPKELHREATSLRVPIASPDRHEQRHGNGGEHEGPALARRLGVWWSAALVVAIELGLLLWIRDGLLLNIIMLVHPIDAVRAWQAGH